MNAKNDLYQDAILALARDSAHANPLPQPDARVRLDNPLCGDRIDLDISLIDGKLSALGHQVRGCLLCQASAALLGQQAIGKSAASLREGADALAALLKSKSEPPADWAALAVFAPVAEAKSRHACVMLPFQALLQSLEQVR